MTSFELRRYVEATWELDNALVHQVEPLTESLREEVVDLLRRAEGFTSVYRVSVDPPDAKIRVDGNPWALGVHTVSVHAPEDAR